MLAYVAVTRAKQVLDNAGLAWIHDADCTLAPSRSPAIQPEKSPAPAMADRETAPSSAPASMAVEL
jgi:hypothetical protein